MKRLLVCLAVAVFGVTAQTPAPQSTTAACAEPSPLLFMQMVETFTEYFAMSMPYEMANYLAFEIVGQLWDQMEAGCD
jgi:hypothetical protein